jgi:hypothetical protein
MELASWHLTGSETQQTINRSSRSVTYTLNILSIANGFTKLVNLWHINQRVKQKIKIYMKRQTPRQIMFLEGKFFATE